MDSRTVEDHQEVVDQCLPLLAEGDPLDLTDEHVEFSRKFLGTLPSAFRSLDASRPWLVFWSLNALELLQKSTPELRERAARTVLAFQHPDGGFGGGIGQAAHLACTYASLATLTLCGNSEAWDQVNRPKMISWLRSVKQSDGSFRVCMHGEIDPRAAYCAMVTIRLLELDAPDLVAGTASYLSTCQTYEGGFANCPFGEAHGGYAFCALAGIILAEGVDSLKHHVDLDSMVHWLGRRQDAQVPGFSGRTNKLVDACYSHWVGGCWPLIIQALGQGDWFDRQGFRDYIVKCSQDPEGGLRDKPGMRPDSYHTNYALCGLVHARFSYKMGASWFDWSVQPVLDEDTTSLTSLLPLNPVFGVPLGFAERMHAHFVA